MSDRLGRREGGSLSRRIAAGVACCGILGFATDGFNKNPMKSIDLVGHDLLKDSIASRIGYDPDTIGLKIAKNGDLKVYADGNDPNTMRVASRALHGMGAQILKRAVEDGKIRRIYSVTFGFLPSNGYTLTSGDSLAIIIGKEYTGSQSKTIPEELDAFIDNVITHEVLHKYVNNSAAGAHGPQSGSAGSQELAAACYGMQRAFIAESRPDQRLIEELIDLRGRDGIKPSLKNAAAALLKNTYGLRHSPGLQKKVIETGPFLDGNKKTDIDEQCAMPNIATILASIVENQTDGKETLSSQDFGRHFRAIFDGGKLAPAFAAFDDSVCGVEDTGHSWGGPDELATSIMTTSYLCPEAAATAIKELPKYSARAAWKVRRIVQQLVLGSNPQLAPLMGTGDIREVPAP